jgi:hypothetical protein
MHAATFAPPAGRPPLSCTRYARQHCARLRRLPPQSARSSARDELEDNNVKLIAKTRIRSVERPLLSRIAQLQGHWDATCARLQVTSEPTFVFPTCSCHALFYWSPLNEIPLVFVESKAFDPFPEFFQRRIGPGLSQLPSTCVITSATTPLLTSPSPSPRNNRAHAAPHPHYNTASSHARPDDHISFVALPPL